MKNVKKYIILKSKKKQIILFIRKDYNPLVKFIKDFTKERDYFINKTKYLELNELMKELNFIERVWAKIFSKEIIKVYNIIRVQTLNSYLK